MMSWQHVEFEKLYAEPSRNGLTRPRRVRGSGYPMINMGEIFAYERIGNITMDRVPMNDSEIKNFDVRVGDLLFARQSLVAAGAGKCSLVKSTRETTTFESHLIRIRLDQKRCNSDFYFYYFLSPPGKANVKSLVMQVAAAGIRGSELAKLRVPQPPIRTQRRIADILSAYDELIENGQRRIKILEAMASSIYREWFVYFRFPGHESVPLVSSSNGEIPQNWDSVKLGTQLLALESGRRPKGGIREIDGGVPSIGAENINGIGRHDFAGEKFIPREFYSEMRSGVVQDRDVAIYKDGAYIGKSSYFRDGFPHFECSVNEHVFLLRSTGERLKQNAMYLWLQESDTVQLIRSKNANAAQPGINQETVRGLDLIVPDSRTAERFDKLIDPVLAEIIIISTKIKNLRQTRDLLLPRLLSGQIEVEEFVS